MLVCAFRYDFTVNEIKKLRTTFELVGTLYLGPEAIPQNDTKVKVNDKIFAIEEVVPLDQRGEQYKKMMATQPEKRMYSKLYFLVTLPCISYEYCRTKLG